jgi:hypothetical protein
VEECVAVVGCLVAKVGASRLLVLLAEAAHERADGMAIADRPTGALVFRRHAKILSDASAVLFGESP